MWVVLEASSAQPHTPGSDISSFPLETGLGLFAPKGQHLQGISGSGLEILSENLECIPRMNLALELWTGETLGVVFLPLLPWPLASGTSVPVAEVGEQLQTFWG